jgi:hypothetical protein
VAGLYGGHGSQDEANHHLRTYASQISPKIAEDISDILDISRNQNSKISQGVLDVY